MVLKVLRRSQLRIEIRKRRSQIPYDYTAYLEKNPSGYIVNDRLLPYPKGEIWKSFMFCIANAKTNQDIELLSGALTTLAFFQDIGEHENLNPPNLTDFNTETDEGFRELVEAEKHYSTLYRQYSPLVDSDFAFFSGSVKKAVAANEHMWPPYKRWWEKIKSLGAGRKIPADWIDFPD